jgi:hypothetical protein
MIVSVLIFFGIFIGLFAPMDWNVVSDGFLATPNIPIAAIRNSVPSWMSFAVFFAAIIPAIFGILLGISIIARRIVFNATAGWSLFVLFFLSVGILSFSLPNFIYGFKEEGEYRTEETFSTTKTPYFNINEIGLDDYHVTSLYLRGYEGTDIRVVKRFQAQGRSRKIASDNAQMVDYHVVQSDSVITFDSNITFRDDAMFRAQRLDVDIYVPYDRPLVIDGELWRLIDNDRLNFTHHNETHRIHLTKQGGWSCDDCDTVSSDDNSSYQDQLGLSDFTAIDMQGLFDVRIIKGDQFAVELDGPEREKGRYEIYVNGSTLVVDYDDKRKYFWKRDLKGNEVKIRIVMPELHDLDVRGAGKLSIRGFDEDDLDIQLTGAVMASGDFAADRLNVELTGASFLDLTGSGRFMQADITGASGLRAYEFPVAHCVVEAHGASMARVNVSETLEIKKGVASSVSHRGDAEVVRR